jgi:TM2 domain-containing membrane protein YozV
MPAGQDLQTRAPFKREPHPNKEKPMSEGINESMNQPASEETGHPDTGHGGHGAARVDATYAAAAGRGRQAHYRAPDPRFKSPFLAAFLSIIPGLGQIYVGYYNRGFVNPVVVGGIMSLLIASDGGSRPPFYFPLAVIFLIFFWLYNVIDAWRRATMYNLALEGFESMRLPDDMSAPSLGGSTFGGAVLVLCGVVILLHTRFGLPLEILEQWWPLVPVLFGGYLIYRDRVDKASGKAARVEDR